MSEEYVKLKIAHLERKKRLGDQVLISQKELTQKEFKISKKRRKK